MSESHRNVPLPTNITLHQASRVLTLSYEDGQQFDLPYEFLRVYTPSAEARGHGPGQEVLQVGKREVAIERVEPVGNYAIRLAFSDGHDSGLYSWDMLFEFCQHRDVLWANYLEKLTAEGASREPKILTPPNASANQPSSAPPSGSCSSGACKK